MQRIQIPADFEVVGLEVREFPQCVKETFDILYAKYGTDHPYYGLSWCEADGGIKYYALARSAPDREADESSYERFTITKGDYDTITITNWMDRIGSIKEAFQELMNDRSPTPQHPCIEWYKSDDEMVCMIKSK